MKADLSETFASELVLLGAADDAALVARVESLIGFLAQASAAPLCDIAYTCARQFPAERRAVLAVIAHSTTDLRARLVSAVARIRGGAARIRDKSGTYYFREHLLGDGKGRLAFVFPGAASFYPDMLRDLAVRFRECRLPFDELEAALAGHDSFQPSTFIFPPAPYYRHDADAFTAGGYAEAVVSTYTANAAMARMLSALGIRPDGATGFAGGDLNALAVGGVFGKRFDRKHRIDFLRETYKVVNNAVSNAGLPKCVLVTMVAPRPDEVERLLASFPPEQLQVAFRFSEKQTTLALSPEKADEILKALGEVGARWMRLAVDRPFNTPWCRNILPLFHKLSSHWVDEKPEIPVYSCGIAEPLPAKTRKVREEAADQWVAPVRVGDTIRRMWADGYRVFLEVGPRGTMTGVIDDVLRGDEYRSHFALATDALHRAGLLQLQHAVGALAALGTPVDPLALFAHRHPRLLDFAAPLSVEVRSETELRLSREFPALTLLGAPMSWQTSAMASSEASTPGARDRKKGTGRLAAEQRAAQRRQQFGFGATCPLVSDATHIASDPGVCEVVKTFTFQDAPFLADFAIGASQLAFSDPSLHGLVPLHPLAGAEILAELAQSLMPSRRVAVIENLESHRRIVFVKGRVRVRVRAERVASANPQFAAFHVQLCEDGPDETVQWTAPALEGVFQLVDPADGGTDADAFRAPAFSPPQMARPREVHWSESDIYPDRLFAGESLRGITSAARWSEVGLDYAVDVPSSERALAHTLWPVWALNPQLLATVADGFTLWRSHERFPGAVSFPFRIRRLAIYAQPSENAHLRCYLRNTSVTPRSLVSDILVSEGNGKLTLEFGGYEEMTERVPEEYRHQLLAPALAYLTKPVPDDMLGAPATPIASAVITDVPYPLFARNEEIWLRVFSYMVLGNAERGDFAGLSGSTSRRTEWLFGRIAAKEAVRRFLHSRYQARWCDADVQIWRDDNGKPHPIGTWKDYLSSSLDLAIAHTAQFVVAVVAANARVGVDVEALDRDLSEEFTRGVFTPEEIELAVHALNAPSAVVRFWCAKEAVSKALGTGIRYSPRELNVETFQAETGEMTVCLTGGWLEAFRQFTGRPITVFSSVVRGHVLATCFIPESFFAENPYGQSPTDYARTLRG